MEGISGWILFLVIVSVVNTILGILLVLEGPRAKRRVRRQEEEMKKALQDWAKRDLA